MIIKITPQLAFDILKSTLSWSVALLLFMKEHIIIEIIISIFAGLILDLKKFLQIKQKLR